MFKIIRNFIQLFAQHYDANYMVLNRTTDTTATTGNDLSPEMKTYYDKRLLDYAQPALVHDQFAQKRPIPQGSGKVIEFRSFSPLAKALTPLTEGITPQGSQLNVTSKTAEVQQYGDFIVQSDILELTALDNTILEATKLLGRQAGKTLDTITRNVLVSGTNVMYAPKINASTGAETEVTSRAGLDTTCVLTVDLIEQIYTELSAMDAPKIDGYYIGIVHPRAMYDLKRDPDWRKPHEYVDTQNIYNGEVGEIGGIRFVESTEAKIFRDNTCPAQTGATPVYYAVFASLCFGDGAFGVTEIEGGGLCTIVKQKGSAGTADPLDQRSSVGWKAIKTAEILLPEYLIRVEHMSSRYSATAQAN